MMINLKWSKLSNKKKAFLKSAPKKTFVMAPTIFQEKRLLNLFNELVEKNDLIIFGVLLDKSIPGLEGGEQFKPASKKELQSIIEKTEEKTSQKILLLEYKYVNARYIIKELKPNHVIAFNGSWKNAIHYQEFWWKSYENGVEIERISPFIDEKAAKDYAFKLTRKLENKFSLNWPLVKAYSETEIKKMLNDLSSLSWDWTGRVGAIITKKIRGEKYKVIAYGYNHVVPYNSYMQHNGSIREREHVASGEKLELGESVHGEISAITNAVKSGKSLKNTQVWVQTFPCPYCARAIAASPISEVRYVLEYSNRLGYELFDKCGKLVERM